MEQQPGGRLFSGRGLTRILYHAFGREESDGIHGMAAPISRRFRTDKRDEVSGPLGHDLPPRTAVARCFGLADEFVLVEDVIDGFLDFGELEGFGEVAGARGF